MSDSRPIGIMDSGLGGISFLLEAVRELPAEHFVYYGDNANLPYGTKSSEQIRKLSLDAAKILASQGVKAIVVACNTASSASLETLRATLSEIPIIGLEPALKPALQISREGRILLLATKGTIELPRLRGMINQLSVGERVALVPCPGLVEAVERGDTQERMRAYIESVIPDKPEDYAAAVLGCTHFIFARPAVRLLMGKDAPVLDGNGGALRQLIRRIDGEELRRTENDKPREILFLSSGGYEAIKRMRRLYNRGLPE